MTNGGVSTSKRRQNFGSMTGPAPDETGTGSNPDRSAGSNESGPLPRRQRGNAGSMGGTNDMNGPNSGSGNAQRRNTSGSNAPSSSDTLSGQDPPAETAEQPKKKKKPKNQSQDQSEDHP